MSRWSFHNPVRVHFGEGALYLLDSLAAGRRYLLVTHPDAVFAPTVRRIAELCGEPLAIIDRVQPNPSLAMLEQICGGVTAIGQKPELIIALGGGSVIDTAKFLAAGQGDFGRATAILEGWARPVGPLPIIALPTTAGTGSDVTCWATIWDPVRNRKLSLADDRLYPEASIIDPALTAGLPWTATLASGLDALSHALESIWNVNASPVTRTFAIAAARDIMLALPRLQASLDDRDARTMMAQGALGAGLAFSNTRTALAHNISYPVTLERGVAHGIACSFCLPEVLSAAIGADAACDDALAEILGDLGQAPSRLRAFLDALGVAPRPADYGITPGDWSRIVADAFAGPRGRNFIGKASRFPRAA